MFSDAIVKLPLGDFDEIRQGFDDYQELALRIASCFEYKITASKKAKECENCVNGICDTCPVLKEHPTDVIKELLADIDALLAVAQDYALYDKDDIDEDLYDLPLKTSWDSLIERKET